MTVIGFLSFKKKKFQWHAELMTIAFAMILVSFLLVMLPSLVMNYMTFGNPATAVFDTSSIVHIPLGTIGLVVGGYLVVRWARNDYKLNKMKAKLLMRVTMVTWVANVLIGAVIYFAMPS